MATTRPTHIEVSTPAPGDGETVSVADARQANQGKRVLAILLISLGAAVVVLGAYWAMTASKLQTADASSGGTHGQLVADPAARGFDTPEPAPKMNPPATVVPNPAS